MKKTIIPLLFLIISASIHAQSTPIEKAIIRDFSVSFLYKYKYEKNQNLRAWAYYTGNKLGYGQVDIEIAVEQIEANNKFRDELFRTFIRFSNSNEELLVMNLISIGMQATNAQKLGKYILENFKTDVSLASEIKKANNNDAIEYRIVDKDARFVGGEAAYRKYLTDNLYYPDFAFRNEVSGVIEVEFTVDIDGSIIDVRIVSGVELGYGLPEEALRVIQSMPKWEPAILKGKPLKSVRRQKLTFKAPTSKSAIENKQIPPKAVFKKTVFSGTKVYCDSLQYWSYHVTINEQQITLTLFAAKNNTNYKDKNKPVEIIKGTISQGIIVTKDAPEYLVNRFKYENGILYEVNTEGGYNDYKECVEISQK